MVHETLNGLASILKEVENADATYKVIFRHANGHVEPNGYGRDLITGWGLEMAIKSSEYKTHADESKKEGEGEGEGEADGEDGAIVSSDEGSDGDLEKLAPEKELAGPLEIDGVLFHTLLKRNPSLKSRLWAFKEALESERDTDTVLKAW